MVYIFLSILLYNFIWKLRERVVYLQSVRDFNKYNPPLARSRAFQIAGADAIGGCSGGIEFSLGAIFGGPVGLGAFVGGVVFGAAANSLLTWAQS